MKKKIVSLGVCLALAVSTFALTTLAEKGKSVNILEYFEIEGATATVQEDSIDFALTGEQAVIRYTKPIAGPGFSFYWNSVPDEQQKLETLGLTLTDSENTDCSVKLTFAKLNETNSAVRFNNESRTYMAAGSTYASNSSDISVSYSERTNTFTNDAENFRIKADKCLNGTAFEGFPSMGVNLELTVTGKPGAVFCLRSINGQPFGSDYEVDSVEPLLCLPNTQTKVIKDAVIELPAAKAFDMLGEVKMLELTVQDPDGETVTDEEGKKLENVDGTEVYRIKCSKYGQYRIRYVTSDGTNKTRSVGYQIAVNDVGAPVIMLEKAMKTDVKVGETVTFSKMKVEDEVEGDITTWINVAYPSGIIKCEKESFVPEEEGIYRVTYSAMDASGNIGRLVVELYAAGGSK